MRQAIWVGMVALSALALTVNCNGHDDDTGSTGSGGSAGGSNRDDPVVCPASIAEVSTTLAEEICAKRTQCCEDDQEACLSEVAAALDTIYPELAASKKAGTASLNCEALEACTLAINEATCNDWPLQSGDLGGLPVDETACLAIITPSLDDGDDCNYNYECVNGLCRVPEGETEGTCLEFARLGASCADERVCDPTTMFCNGANVCQTRLPEGAVCTVSGQCASRLCLTVEGEGEGECVSPGPRECEYVPNGAAHCALGSTPGGGTAPYNLLAAILAGLCISGARRRRAQQGCSA